MSFVWPWQYSFPPFFTLQPNGETRQKQLAAWCALALAYSQEHRLPAMTVREAQDIPLFANHRLQRKLPLESIQVVLEELRKNGNLEWLDKNKTSFLIMWKRPEEWGKLIYQWVSKNGLTNSVFTLYELVSGDDTENEEFHGLDEAFSLPHCPTFLSAVVRGVLLSSQGSALQVAVAHPCCLLTPRLCFLSRDDESVSVSIPLDLL
ncbi:vacuolar protein-sorting-associated protein 25 isoform X2 [Camarhynchus parvulus]|uniref:vacuolar protein-sorting-associated protein 25 isoform X2 n=1 Tax=Geospiza parvula TaxID=87175 RepID=UPI001237EE29|nr:vacuolar protein-sorting-associated protein 25 isoform X2 [Camarhynchus parvulus]